MEEWEKVKAELEAEPSSLEEWRQVSPQGGPQARAAARQAWLGRYLDAMRAALATVRANPEYRIIVEYLAECSARGIVHIVLDVLMTNILERGCTLTSAQVQSFLEWDLRLNIWEYHGDVMVRSPQGWTPERGSYPFDVSTIWDSWAWYPPAESEWDHPRWSAADRSAGVHHQVTL